MTDRQPKQNDGPPRIEVAFSIEGPAPDTGRFRAAVRRVMRDAGIASARVGIAVIDDPAIHEMNRRYLKHDYPTDVLSFVLEQSPGHVEGQIAVSAETARREASGLGWPAEDELLLYVVHGALHLVGYNDSTPTQRDEMRRREREVLAAFGLEVPWDEASRPAEGAAQPRGGRRRPSRAAVPAHEDAGLAPDGSA